MLWLRLTGPILRPCLFYPCPCASLKIYHSRTNFMDEDGKMRQDCISKMQKAYPAGFPTVTCYQSHFDSRQRVNCCYFFFCRHPHLSNRCASMPCYCVCTSGQNFLLGLFHHPGQNTVFNLICRACPLSPRLLLDLGAVANCGRELPDDGSASL